MFRSIYKIFFIKKPKPIFATFRVQYLIFIIHIGPTTIFLAILMKYFFLGINIIIFIYYIYIF